MLLTVYCFLLVSLLTQPATAQAISAPVVSSDSIRPQYAKIAKLVTFPWAKDGEIQAGGDDPIDVTVSLFDVSTNVPELQQARKSYLPVAVAQMAGFKMAERKERPTVGDLIKLAEILGNAIVQRYELVAKDVVMALVGSVVKEAARRVGNEIFAKGIRLHTEVWKVNLVPVARRIAGPQAANPPLRVEITRGTEPQTGLSLANVSGKVLHNVTIQVDSKMGATAFEGVAQHFVFLAKWESEDKILLAPMTVLSVLEFKPLDSFSPQLTYSLWCDEQSAEVVTVRLSRDDYRHVQEARKPVFALELTATGKWARVNKLKDALKEVRKQE